MRSSSLSTFCLLLAVTMSPALLQAQTPNADVQALRAQLEALKTEYQTRIAALEKQLEEVQTQLLRVPEPEPAAAPTPAPVGPGALNPAISVVGNFLGRADNQKVFLADGVTRIDNQFNLREAEIDFRAPVDPYADAVLISSFESDSPGISKLRWKRDTSIFESFRSCPRHSA
jgi:hypothetical protein